MKTISQFRGDYSFLSNFYPCWVTYQGQRYKNAEAAFQAAKCANPLDRIRFQKYDPAQAKKAGRRVQLRPDWDAIKTTVMHDVLTAKFTSNPDLTKRLLGTSDRVLVEGNLWHDNYWGCCSCSRCGRGSGQNMLGRLLMQVREELRMKGGFVHPTKEQVEAVRLRFPKGKRVELVSMNDPYSGLKPGDQGTVDFVDDVGTAFVRWDCGSGLGIVYGLDEIKPAEGGEQHE